MARYRKIDPRIWNDEKFMTFDPLEKLVWFALLTHPLMTPMGAGVIYPGVLDDILGNTAEWCFRCHHPCTQHTAETYLETFRERSLIYRDHGLIIVKNYLLYNLPDNQNQLLSWIGACKELPRSERFRDLLDHLQNALQGQPLWLFQALLIPLANQHPRGLAKHFGERVGQDKKAGSNVSANPDRYLPGKVSKKVSRKVRGNHPRNQEQEQDQEQEEEQNESIPPPSPSADETGVDLTSPADGDSQYAWPSPEALVDKFNTFTPASVQKVRVLSPARRQKAQRALTLFPAETFWDDVCAEYYRSTFLQGLRAQAGHERFRADFDWLLSRGQDGIENCVKVHDGKYRDQSHESPTRHNHDVRAARNLAAMEAFLKGGSDDGTRAS
jgi:hypothetical protein